MEAAYAAELPSELMSLIGAGAEVGGEHHAAVAALAKMGIITPIGLYLARFIPPDVDLPNSKVAHFRSVAANELNSTTTSALELFDQHNENPRGTAERLTTCLDPLDRILGGGYPARRLIQIAGAPQSFRTLILFHATLSYLLQHSNATCCWIDTKGTFNQDVTRTVSIIRDLADGLRKQGRQFKTRAGEDETEEQIVARTLERLLISVRIDREGTLETIGASVRDSTDERRVGLVVIDSIDTILETDPAAQTKAHGYSNQVNFMQRLTAFTRAPDHPVTVFVVNSAVEQHATLPAVSVLPNPSRTPLLRPALGPTFAYLTDLTLCTTRGEKAWGRTGDGTGVVEVIASRAGGVGEWVAFKTDGIAIKALE